ncbi:IST1 homolog isoform X2 [Aethina tumida]|uniref:IST1 homolog isoform X2 n=1 Tax=Aethina tumida TaxID=116153 RepID=UPI00214770B6|nr:IST1 homolog isoform X2 [Aethina tumida]
MFSSSPNYNKLKTNLRLSISRLKLLEKKKTEQTEKSRREIADFLANGKHERAKIRVEYIIREDYLVEALEIVEMYCDLLLARFGMITNMKELDDGIAEAVSSLIWVAPRLQSDCQELKIIGDLLASKYGPNYAECCRNESVDTISAKLKQKLSIQSPPKILVEKYVIEIAHAFNIPYEPDPQVMSTDTGKDALLIDLSQDNKNNLGGGGMPQPPGFFGYPQPPALPNFQMPPAPFSYPAQPDTLDMGASAPPPAFSYNIPPGDDSKESNMDSLPKYNNLYPNSNLQNDRPKPMPRTKMNDLPDLPSVPSDLPPARAPSDTSSDIDFDDLTRRFNELKKKY